MGLALLVVLVILLIVAASSATFIWFMNQQQSRAGAGLRAGAALAAAEAGVHRALAILESVTPDGSAPGRAWRPTAYGESQEIGGVRSRFTVAVSDDPDGAVVITSTGEAGGLTRRVRARVHLTSPALLTALYGASLVRIDRMPARLTIVPYGRGTAGRPWVHIAAGRGIGFASTEVAINDPAEAGWTGPGPADAPDPAGIATPAPPAPARLLLARGAELAVGPDHQRVDAQQLRVMGLRIDGDVLRVETLPPFPDVDRAYFQARARGNAANTAINAAAGQHAGDEGLLRKPDSLYSPDQFAHLLRYLQARGDTGPLRGVVYVRGGVTVPEEQTLTFADGALITEGMLRVGRAAVLTVAHSAATRTLPGILVLDGALLVTQGATLRAHGLVYADRIIDLWDGARLDVVGAVAGNDRGLSVRNIAAAAVIRYDPAVLGTPGLRVPDGAPVIAWVSVWEELR